jgi:hypothetical protein
MSSSSNITTMPSMRALTRASDDALVLVNMAFVRMITQQSAGVLRLHFGPQGNDNIDVKLVTIDELQRQMVT